MTEDLEELQNRLFGVLQDFSRQRSSSAAENETRLLSMAREIDSLRQQLKDEKESKQRDAATRSLELDERTNTLLKQLQQQQSDIECLRGDNTTLTQQLRDLQQRFVASQERLKATELADETLQHAIARIAAVEKEKTELLAEVASYKHQADVCLQRATTAEREVQYVESRCSQANSRAESLQEQVYRLSRDAVLCKTCDILKKDLSATQYELRRSQDGSVEALVRFGTFVMEQVEGASREALQNMYHEMASRHKSDLDWLADKFQEAVTISTNLAAITKRSANELSEANAQLSTFRESFRPPSPAPCAVVSITEAEEFAAKCNRLLKSANHENSALRCELREVKRHNQEIMTRSETLAMMLHHYKQTSHARSEGILRELKDIRGLIKDSQLTSIRPSTDIFNEDVGFGEEKKPRVVPARKIASSLTRIEAQNNMIITGNEELFRFCSESPEVQVNNGYPRDRHEKLRRKRRRETETAVMEIKEEDFSDSLSSSTSPPSRRHYKSSEWEISAWEFIDDSRPLFTRTRTRGRNANGHIELM